MREIPLTQGQVALVDDCDYEWLMQWHWRAQNAKTEDNPAWYACRGRGIWMHREIARRAGILVPSLKIDHRDRNGLHNWRANIRAATNSQNQQNRNRERRSRSSFKGLYWNDRDSVWVARIKVDGQRIWLGAFRDEAVAARAYDDAARLHFGQYASTNFQ